MAAQVAAVGALACVGAGVAHGEDRAATANQTATASEHVADLLRLQPESKGCFQPVTWGPPAPPAFEGGSVGVAERESEVCG